MQSYVSSSSLLSEDGQGWPNAIGHLVQSAQSTDRGKGGREIGLTLISSHLRPLEPKGLASANCSSPRDRSAPRWFRLGCIG